MVCRLTVLSKELHTDHQPDAVGLTDCENRNRVARMYVRVNLNNW